MRKTCIRSFCTAFLIVFLLAAFAAPVRAETVASGECGASGNNLTWGLDDAGTLTISGSGKMKNYDDPRIIGATLEPWYEYREEIRDIVIGSGCTYVGSMAFMECTDLRSVSLPSSLTAMDDCAFYMSKGSVALTIPKNLTSLHDDYGSAFTSANCFVSFTVDASNTKFSSVDGILYNKNKTKLIRVPSGKEGNVTIESTVTSMQEEAMSGCCFSGLAMPTGITAIPDYMLSGNTGLETVTLSANTASLGKNSFANCSSLTSISLGNKLTTIGEYAFMGCSALSSVSLPSTVRTIGMYAFNGSGLTQFEVPSGITSLASGICRSCSRLSSVSLNNLTSIGYGAFAECPLLTSVTVPETVTTIDSQAFYKSGITSVRIPKNVTAIGTSAFSCCSSLDSITVDSANTKFKSADGILLSKDGKTLIAWPGGRGGNVQLMSGLETLAGNSMSGVAGLTLVEVPEGVKTIEGSAFSVNTDLRTVILPNSLTSLGTGVFYQDTALKNVNIPAGITSLQSDLFLGSGLERLVIPASVRSVGSSAFRWCEELKEIVFEGDAPSFAQSFEFGNDSLTAYYPENNTSWNSPITKYYNEISIAWVPYSNTPVLTAAPQKGGSELKLSWNRVPSALKYTVKVKRAGESAFSELTQTDQLSVTVQEPAGTGARYCVISVGPTTHSGESNFVDHDFVLAAPEISVKRAADGKPAVSWKSISGAAGYAVTVGNGLTGETQTVYVSGTSYTHTAAQPNTYYQYSVRALKTAGTAGQGDSAESSGAGLVCGVAPVTLSGSTDALTGKPVISWTGSEGAVSYTLYSRVKGGSFKEAGTFTGSIYVHSAASAGREYEYKAVANGSSGVVSAASEVLSLSCGTNGLSALTLSAANTADGIKLSWNKIGGAGGYVLYRKISGESSYTKLKSTALTSVTDTEPAAGKTVYYKLRAYKKVNGSTVYGAYSTLTAARIAKASGLSVSVKSDGFAVSWKKVSGATGYELYRKVSGGSYKKVAELSGTSYKDTAVSANKTYTYKVRALKTFSSGTVYKGVYSATATRRFLSRPVIDSVTAGSKQAAVSWGRKSGVTGYQLQYGTDSAFGSCKSVKLSGSDSLSKLVKSLTAGKKYYFRLRTYYSTGSTTYYSAWSVKKGAVIK